MPTDPSSPSPKPEMKPLLSTRMSKVELIRKAAELLRASEASVESLRKERDGLRNELRITQATAAEWNELWVGAVRALESSRAEATKAEHDRALNWAADFAANHSCDEHCECSDFIAADLRVAAGKYRVPSSPTPPTSPPSGIAQMEPPCPDCTPPSEEPRPDCPNCGLSWSNWQAKRCIGCGYTAIHGGARGARESAQWDVSPMTTPPPSEGPSPERIVAAAIQSGPVTFTGPHHAAIIHYVSRCAGIRPVRGEQGFVTNAGRFVDRAEALAIAIEAGQVDPSLHHNMGLMSENLWIVPESTASEQPDGKTR